MQSMNGLLRVALARLACILAGAGHEVPIGTAASRKAAAVGAVSAMSSPRRWT